MLVRRILLGIIFTLLVGSVFAQKANYEFANSWKEIDGLLEKNLTKTALIKIADLAKTAEKNGNATQVLKAMTYRLSFEEKVTENDINQQINILDSALRLAKDSVIIAFYHSLIANTYLQYFNDYRWKIYQRKSTVGVKSTDIAAWSADDFQQSILSHFKASLQPEHLLRQPISNMYEPLIAKGNTLELRPSLFDILAHEALDYFKTLEGNMTKPIDLFRVNDPETISGYRNFIELTFPTTDTNSHALISLQLFQKLIRFHLNDNKKEALLDVDLERIEWVKQQGVFSNKDEKYLKVLRSITEEFKSSELCSKALLMMATQLNNEAGQYLLTKNSKHQFKNVEAKKLIEYSLKTYGNSRYADYGLHALLQRIIYSTIQTEVEKVNTPNKPFRLFLKFKNVDTVYCRVLDVNKNPDLNERYSSDLQIARACSTKPLRTSFQALPTQGDFQEHSVELKMEGLPAGNYVLLTSSDKEFRSINNPVSFLKFQNSQISYIIKNDDLFLLDRESGKPIKHAKVTVLAPINRNDWNSELTKVSSGITDENGHCKINKIVNKFIYRFIFETEKEVFKTAENDYMNFWPVEKIEAKLYEKQNKNTFFFTDRSIYRPGQWVYFKGIVVTKDAQTSFSKIITGETGKIYLRDANRTIIDSITYTTNDYGSFNGKFLLPEKGLSGNYSIQKNKDENGIANFSVEQYKRPTYQIVFEKNKGTWRLNDSIQFNGNAKALAGNSLNQAKIVYHIMRAGRPNYANYNRYSNQYLYSANQEIAFGESETDSLGNFRIKFKAIPDESIDSAANILYDFTLDVTITDGSGETRTAKTKITCGYQSLVISVFNQAALFIDSSYKFTVNTRNLEYQELPANVKIRIKSLTIPDRIFRKRYWAKPDLYLMDKKEFWKYFPTDEYENETDFTTYAKAAIVYEGELNTAENKQLTLPPGTLAQGNYVIEISLIDNKEKAIQVENYFKVFDTKNATTQFPNFVLTYQENKALEPTQSTTISSLLMAKETFVISQTSKQTGIEPYRFQLQKKGWHQTVFTASENDRGGIIYEEVFVYNNRIYQNYFRVEIPWLNKSLKVTYSSYRNKTLPGADETWSIQLEGNKGEKIVGEILTSMYDASLDAFKNHQWYFPNLWQYNRNSGNWTSGSSFLQSIGQQNYYGESYSSSRGFSYDRLSFGFPEYFFRRRGNEMLYDQVVVGNGAKSSDQIQIRGSNSAAMKEMKQEESYDKVFTQVELYDKKTGDRIVNGKVIKNLSQNIDEPIRIRNNFSETAFFIPQLMADSNGNYQFSFKMPDAVTKWKWQSLAHTKDLATGYQIAEIQTQKTLMVQSNAPRFMREGDKMEFSTRIANMSDKEITGQVTLELIDPKTNTSIDGWFQNVFPTQYFTVAANQSSAVKFPIQIPFSYNRPLTWRVVAKSGNYSDGEENLIPVLSNRQLVTETLPLHTIGDTSMQLVFDKLLNQKSASASNESLTVEFSSNPTWYAIQALPYLQEGNDQCVEGVFSRFYANALAAYIMNKYPWVKKYYQAWKTDSVSLVSNLQKNESLKQLLLNETPWVLAAKSATEQMQQLAQLFNLAKLSEEIDQQIIKLQGQQLSCGGFSWFKGGYDDPYMTMVVITGIGKLKRLGAITPDIAIRLKPMLERAIGYLDKRINDQYRALLQYPLSVNDQHISYSQVQYLYLRSFYGDMPNSATDAWNYFMQQGRKYWSRLSIEEQAQMALVFHRNKEYSLAYDKIMPTIMENGVYSREKGMYWKTNRSYFWRGSPMATVLMATTMAGEILQGKKAEVLRDQLSAMKTYVLLNKETNHWGNSMATADACYALLLNGDNWLEESRTVTIQLGKTIINSSAEKTLAGTGYFQKRFEGNLVDPSMGNISIRTASISTVQNIQSTKSSTTKASTANKSSIPAWGAVYWQYFEEMDKITSAASPLKIKKQLMVEKNTNKGKVLVPIDAEHPLHVGDKLVVRLEISTDRDMEYIHLKDSRAAGMEPQNVLSSYKWQGGLGYYESTSDASTNFFFDRMAKGVYVFEYPVFLTHLGDFSAGIATIQCLYAPSMNSHSEGIRIQVVE